MAMDTYSNILSGRVREILPSSIHDANVDLIRKLFSTAALEPADDFHRSHLWKSHFASTESSFELVRV